MFSKTSLLGSSTLSSALPTTYADIRGEDIMTDPRVIADVRKEFEDRGIYIADDDELMRKFYDDQTFSKLNTTIGSFNAYQRAEAATPESRARQARLRDAHNKLPAFFQKGGVGAGTALPSYGKALLFDPINLVGGFVGASGKGVAKAAQVARAAGGSPTLAAARAGAMRGAAYEGVLGAGFGAAYSVGNQNVDIKLGLQDQFSFGQLAADVAGEAAFSAGIGAVAGGVGGAIFKGGRRLDPDVAPEDNAAAPVSPVAPPTATPTPAQYQDALLQDAAEARANGQLDLEEDLLSEYTQSMSYDTSAVTFDTTTDAAPSMRPTVSEAAEEISGEATEEAAPAGPDMSQRTRGNASKKAEKAAAENEIDLTVDAETGAFNDPELEKYVISRALRGENKGRVTNTLNFDDIRAFIASRGTAPLAEEPSASTASTVVANVLNNKQIAEQKTGQVGTAEDTVANLRREAEEAGIDPDEVLTLQGAMEKAAEFQTGIMSRYTALSAEEMATFDARLTELRKGKKPTPAMVVKALDEADRGRAATAEATPKRVADRTAKAAGTMATGDVNAGRSLTVDVDPTTQRQTMKPGRYQKIFQKQTNLPTFNSVKRSYAEMLARASLDREGKVTGRDVLGKQMAADKRKVADLTSDEQIRYNALVEQFNAEGKPNAEQRALNQINRELKQSLEGAVTLDDQGRFAGELAAENGLITYVTTGRMKAATKESFDDMVPPGTVIIYDAELNQSFGGETYDEAKELLSRVLRHREQTPIERQAAREADAQAIAQFTDANGVTRYDYGATALDQQDPMLSTPASKGNLRLVAKYVGPEEGAPSVRIRQASNSNISKGGNFRAMLGMPRAGQAMEARWNPENWELYYAPEVAGVSNKQQILEEMISGMEPIKTGRDDLPLQRKSYDDKIAGAPLFRDIAELELPVPETDEEQALFKSFLDNGQSFATFQDLLTREAEMWRVGLKGGNAGQLIQRASMFYSYMSRVLPQGITYPQATRQAAYKALEGMYRDADTETLQMLLRLVTGVKTDGAPTLVRGTDMPKDVGGSYRPAAVQTDEVGVGQFEFKSSGEITLNTESGFHPMHALLHELGHWSTDYVLTPRIKASWFTELAQYLDDNGNLRMDRLGLSGAPEGLDVGANFQEVFANLFTKWASDKVFRKSLQNANLTFFEKLGRIFQQLFDFFMSGGVPEKFDPIFSNILDDTDRLIFRITDMQNPPKDKTAQAIQSRFSELEDLKGEWTTAIEQGSSLEGLAVKTLGYLHSLTNTKAQNKWIAGRKGGAVRGKNTGTFEPIQAITFQVRRAISDINDVLLVLDTSKSQNEYGYNPAAEDLPFITDEFSPEKYERIADAWTGNETGPGVIQNILATVESVLETKFDEFSSGQNQMRRRANMRKAAKASIGQQASEQRAAKKGRWRAFANSAYYEANISKPQEALEKEAVKLDIPVDASIEELASYLDFTNKKGAIGSKNRVVAQLIKRKMDAEPVDEGVEKYTGDLDRKSLMSLMLKAYHDNDMADFAKYRSAYRSMGGKESVAPQDGMVDNLRLAEIAENGINEDGVSLGARPQIQDLQRRMNVRRDEETTATMRQLFFRTMNLLGGTKAGGEPAREAILAPLFGRQAEAGGPALTEASEMFRSLRTQMRKIAQGLKGGDDPVRDVALLAIRGSNDMGLDRINGQPADEFMADAVVQLLSGRTTFDRVFPDSPDRATFLRRARNYMDRTGYLVNGLIASPALRKKYPGLTVYGDMFANNKRPITAMHGVGNAVAPEVAADAFAEVLRYGTARLRNGIQTFTKGAFNLTPDGIPTAMYIPVRRGRKVDNQGRAQTNGMFGVATYISSDPVGALRTKTGDIPARVGFEAEAEDLLQRVASIDRSILQTRGQQAMADTSVEATALRDKLASLLDQREGLLEKLDATGRTFDDVAPVVTRAQAVANFQQNVQYTPDSPMVSLLMDAISSADQRAGILFSQTIDDVIDGDDLYVAAVDVLERTGLGQGQARNVINQRLRTAGYDGVAGTMDDEGVARPVFAIFDGDNVRSLRAPDLPVDPDDETVLKSGVGAAFWELVSSEAKLPPTSAGAVEDYLRVNTGVSEAVANTASSLITGSRTRVGMPVGKMLSAFLDGAEQRFQKAGMKALAARFNDFSAEHTRMTGQIIMPILEGSDDMVGLNNLPGMPDNLLSKVANYMTTSWQGNKVLAKQFNEPAPLRRIRAAMIDPSKAPNLANAQEREMYAKLRARFRKQLDRMKAAGILVGDLGPDFFPQVWNPEIIRRDEQGFKSLMFSYLKRENPQASNDDAKAFADKIFANITGNDSGVVDFDADSPKALIDSVDFSRLLKFHQVAPELLESAQKYQEQSLMATVVRYFDETERVIQQADHFGVNGHGIMDYAKAAQEGRSGIIELLATDKHFSTGRYVVGPDGAAKQNKTIGISMLPEGLAVQAADRAMALARTDIEGARQYLYDVYPADTTPITYRRRVDAIIDALKDYKGQEAGISGDDRMAAEGYSRLIMRKPADRSSQSTRNVSRNLRAFQNVTLLSYATITSFSDLAMPIIRSGDFKAAWQGWSKYLTNKEYRDSIRRIGIAMDGITHERMAQLVGDGSNIIQSTFFKMTGLTPWTNMQRAGAAAIAEHGLRHHMEALKKMGSGAKGTPAYNRHARELVKFGMTFDPSQPLPQIGGGTEADAMFERAIIRFTDATIFSPKPHDMPLFANNPWGAMVYQLKSFQIMYGRFAMEMLKDEPVEAWKAMRAGDFGTAAQHLKKPALLMTLGPAVAAGSIATKDLVMARGGEEGQSFGINQTTKLSNTFGPEWSDEQLDAMAGWYMQSFMQAGGFGLLGDIFRTTAEQADNGAYGQQRIAETILGPTFGLFNDALKVTEGVKDAAGEAMGGEGSPGKQRQAIREVVGRTPLLGGNRALKEALVDLKPVEGKSSGVGGSAYKRTTYGTTEF